MKWETPSFLIDSIWLMNLADQLFELLHFHYAVEGISMLLHYDEISGALTRFGSILIDPSIESPGSRFCTRKSRQCNDHSSWKTPSLL